MTDQPAPWFWDRGPLPQHINHDRPGADITDCPACLRLANLRGADW